MNKLMNKILHFFKKQLRSYKKFSKWTKILFWVMVLAFIFIFTDNCSRRKEGFAQMEKYVLKRNDSIYDEFYVNIYDDLVYNTVKDKFEANEIVRATKLGNNPNTIGLDVGCGGGHHVHLLNMAGIETHGLDLSPAMINKAKETYPKWVFDQGNVLESMKYPGNTFNLMTCLYFTIYYIEDKQLFFKNCNQWLKPGGFLVVHLVNRDTFDPILPAADPLHLVSPQKYAEKRITNSLVKFKNFQYKANFKLKKEDNVAFFDETFKDDTSGHIRQNIHTFHMPTQKHILSLATENGFELLGKIDLVSCQYENQYLYILKKK